MEGEIGRFRRRHMTPVPRAASLAELNQMLADADEVDEHRRIAARTETVGQAAAREVPLLNPLPGNAFQAAAALSCRVDAKARICVRQSYYSVPARLAGRRGARSRWALTGSTSGMTGFWSPGTPDHCTRAARTWCWTTTWRSSCHRPGALAGATALVSARADRRVHRWAPTVLGHRTPQGRGPRRHQGADRGAAAAPHPAHRGGARRDRRSGGGWCSLKFGTGVIRAGVGDPGASFVTPSPISCHRTCPQGSLPEPICGRTPPGVKRRSQTGHGRPGVVPGSSRDGIWGVVFGAVMGLRLRSPLLGCRGWINLPGPRSPLLAPAGYLRFPGPDQTVIVGPYQVDRTIVGALLVVTLLTGDSAWVDSAHEGV